MTDQRKVVIKAADMPEIQKEVIDLTLQAFNKFTVEKDIASHIKRTLDTRYGPTFHVIVGRSFGSYVTHESKYFIYFYVDQFAVLIFKSG
ncbi:dynein light chain [Anaeramoeba flamelloides]|uniref:Dynein light chain n=1 Tax=Anaeramoeba flamelloides TaxID=1746091 RepID=A0AAV7ZUJ1_9EUKA|nr:dynein light chain [Anaeramoeba flamelloides]KAJ6242892.1 dynein light chain [Anaeramoeba flamelloides]